MAWPHQNVMPAPRLLLLGVLAATAKHHGEDIAAWVRGGGGAHANASLDNARAGVERALADLVQYYDGDTTVLGAALGLADDTALAARMALAMAGRRNRTLSAAAAGSSVTAGHGGFGDAAWPLVLERRVAPVWALFGVRFVVHNQAVGGRDPWPASWCLSPMMGDDVDIVMREWEYWAPSDGLHAELKGKAAKKPADADLAGYEMLLRVALTMPRQPAVHFVFLGAGGASSTYERVSKLRQALAPGGALAAYAQFAVDAFDAFGKPFAKLRAAAPKRRVDKKGEKPCEGPNIADCPLAPRRQDGYHARAAHPGYDEREHAAWRAHDNNNLFVNWHPGALGHEVIGSQLAFAHLRLMLRALDMLARAGGGDLARLERLAAPRALPPPKRCAPALCGFDGYRPACAYSTLPKVHGPDVADWAVNDTAPGAAAPWTNAPCSPDGCAPAQVDELCARSGRDSAQCYGRTLACSSRDRKRALRGTGASQPLLLRVPLARRAGAACRVLLSEGSYQWSKPLQYANWRHELEIELDGRRCTPPACQVLQASGGYRQDLLIDVKLARGARDGAACSAKGPAEIVLRVKPVAVGDEICVKMPRHGRCEAAGAWRRYDAQCIKKPDGGCALKAPRSARPQDVAAFVTQVVAW